MFIITHDIIKQSAIYYWSICWIVMGESYLDCFQICQIDWCKIVDFSLTPQLAEPNIHQLTHTATYNVKEALSFPTTRMWINDD